MTPWYCYDVEGGEDGGSIYYAMTPQAAAEAYADEVWAGIGPGMLVQVHVRHADGALWTIDVEDRGDAFVAVDAQVMT